MDAVLEPSGTPGPLGDSDAAQMQPVGSNILNFKYYVILYANLINRVKNLIIPTIRQTWKTPFRSYPSSRKIAERNLVSLMTL